jgi:hypothetical protein
MSEIMLQTHTKPGAKIWLLLMFPQPLCWALATFSVSWSYTQSVGLLGREISSPQGLYLHTGQHKHNKRIDIYASSGIRTRDWSVWEDKDSSCLRYHGRCDRKREIIDYI